MALLLFECWTLVVSVFTFALIRLILDKNVYRIEGFRLGLAPVPVVDVKMFLERQPLDGGGGVLPRRNDCAGPESTGNWVSRA